MSFDPVSREEFVSNVVVPRNQFSLDHTIHVSIHARNERIPYIGAGVFIRNEKSLFLITADHVVAKFISIPADLRVISFGFEKALETSSLQEHEICRDSSLDLATIQLPPELPDRIGQFALNASQISASPAGIGEDVFFMGAPASSRQFAHGTYYYESFNAWLTVDTVEADQFSFRIDDRHTMVSGVRIEIPPDFGGISGGPVFRVVKGTSFELLGIFKEARSFGEAVCKFYAVPASFISPDGKFR